MIGRYLLLLLIVSICICWWRGCILFAALALHTSSTESNAVIYVDSNGVIECMFSDELFRQPVVIVILMEKDAISPATVDLYLDDGCMVGCVPMSAPRELVRL